MTLFCGPSRSDNFDKRKPNMKERNEHGRSRRPADWRHVHHSPLFWVGAVLFLAAIAIYLGSDDLSWRPHVEAR
jgi:hypothetical protein